MCLLTRKINSFFSAVSSLANKLRQQAAGEEERGAGPGSEPSQHRCHYSRSLHQRRFPFRGITSLPLLELFSPRKEFPEACSGYRRHSLPEQAASLGSPRGAGPPVAFYFTVETWQRGIETKIQLDKFINKSRCVQKRGLERRLLAAGARRVDAPRSAAVCGCASSRRGTAWAGGARAAWARTLLFLARRGAAPEAPSAGSAQGGEARGGCVPPAEPRLGWPAGCDRGAQGANESWAAAGEPSRAGFGPPGAPCCPCLAAGRNAQLLSWASLRAGEL